MSSTSISWRASIGRVSLLLSALVVATSMLDLFVNRLLFRGGPEVMKDVSFPGISNVATIGRISFTFEQVVLFVILGGAAALMLRERSAISRNLGFLLLPLMLSAALLYLPLSQAMSWDFSMLLVLLTGVEIFGLLALRARSTLSRFNLHPSLSLQSSGMERAGALAFLVSVGVAFFLPLYNRVSVLLVGLDLPSLPGQMDAYVAGVYMIVVASVAAFAYSLTVRSPGYKMGIRSFAKAALLPTLLVVPVFIGLMESFFMTQIMSMVIAMSTDILLDFQMVRVVTMGWWFVMVAVFVLWFKGRGSHDWFLVQQGIGLAFILSTTFLFGYPNYLLLGTAGVLLLCYPLHRPSGVED